MGAKKVFKAVVKRVRKGKNAVGSTYTRYWTNTAEMRKSAAEYAKLGGSVVLDSAGRIVTFGSVLRVGAVGTVHAATRAHATAPGILKAPAAVATLVGGTYATVVGASKAGDLASKMIRKLTKLDQRLGKMGATVKKQRAARRGTKAYRQQMSGK